VLEKDKADMNALKDSLTSKKEDLDAQIYEVRKILANLGKEQNKYQQYYDELAAQEQKVQQEIQNATGQYNAIFDGNFMWPLPGKRADYVITSHFNANRIHPVYGYPAPHNGTDYSKSSIANQPIYAAAAGKVTVAKFNDGGYGWYVTIEHGKLDGKVYSTLYAHMTRYVVKVGDIVRKGQVIGYVGKTGAATGYHLHLEVRVNGTPTNPIQYAAFK
jgi:murein DD-endopeptidase MepM/ murein hydrolase activator NlpD